MSTREIALITGTNSNLGVNIAYRLLESIPTDHRLTLIVTSRSLPRVNEIITKIADYNSKVTKRKAVLDFDYLLVDFTNMVSVLSAYYELSKRYTAINYLYINAAQGVYDGIDWIQATKEVILDPLESVTNPTFKIQRVGVKSKDGLGLVFQANVFGPYYLIHRIKSILSKGKARVIWISSLMSDAKYLSFDDLQLLKSNASYEGSKRLVDLVHLATYRELKEKYNITQYVAHPGIFTSFSFFQYLNVFTYYGMLFLFYLARFIGSPWHNISGYKAANSIIYTSLKADSTGADSQDLKYGSACKKNGMEYIKVTEIDPQGAADVLKYIEELTSEWDENLKDQIAVR